MGSRISLHYRLCDILGSEHVYFQPPASMHMTYPAIVYSLDQIDNDFANNDVYMQSRRYLVTVIDEDPDSEIATKVSKLPSCQFSRFYSSENLNHYAFNLYF